MQTIVDVVGWCGALLILGAYALLSMGRLQGRSRLYQLMNLLGGVGLAINGQWNRAYPSVGLNVVWIGIGLFALLRAPRAPGD